MRVLERTRRQTGWRFLWALFVTGQVVTIGPLRGQATGFPIVTAYSSSEIGTDARSWISLQEVDRTMLFGCNGLVGFDGERWTSSAIPAAYALRGLDLGPDGRLWAAANGNLGWFERQFGPGWRFHSLNAELKTAGIEPGEPWRVYADKQGALFVTENQILRWDGRTFQAWPMPGGRYLSSMRVRDTIFIHHRATGLYAMEAGGPSKIFSDARLANDNIFWMEARGAGWLLATSKGLFTYADGQLDRIDSEGSDFAEKMSLTCAVRLPDGRLALGTYLGGIAIVRTDGKIDQILDESSGLPTHAIYSVFADREGALWVTSATHIMRVAVSSASAIFGQRAGLPAQPCLKIAEHDGRLEVATENGVYELQPDGRSFHPPDIFREHVWDMRSTTQGLLVTSERTVHLLSGRESTTVFSVKDKDTFVAQPSWLDPQSTLIAVGHTIVRVGADRSYRTLVEELPDLVTWIAEDEEGRLWLGTPTRGVLTAETDPYLAVRAKQVAPSFGLPEVTRAEAVLATRDGGILVFAPAGGWIKARGNQRFEPISAYPSRPIMGASDVDASGAAWLVLAGVDDRPACVGRVVVSGSHAQWQPHSVEGLSRIGVPRCLYASAGDGGRTTLWIGGTDGLLRNVVATGPVVRPPGQPLLRAYARTVDSDVPQRLVGALPYSTRAVLFEFAEPEFALRPMLRLQTLVEGVDRDWRPAGPDSRRELTALRDGRYVVRVRALAETGIASEPAEFEFAILPPWWRTGPAMTGGVLALALAMFGIYRLRVRALRHRNIVLEERVRDRTMQLAEASAAKTQFVANMSHGIRNPLNGIVGLALALENTRLETDQREIVATLRECTTYLSSLVDDVLDFASIEAGRVELRLGPFAPQELLRSVATTLTTEAAARGATLQIESDPNLPAAMRGDAGRIQQILVNYVGNAIKYAGGTITLSAHVVPSFRDEVEFSVADRGAGIIHAEQAALFKRFSRLPGARRIGVR